MDEDDKNRAKLLDIVVPDAPTVTIEIESNVFAQALASLTGPGTDYVIVATLLLRILNQIAPSDKIIIVRELERSILATPSLFIQNNKLLVQSILLKFSKLVD